MKIGVFDSGIGGRAIAEKIQVAFPDTLVVCVDDHDHLPYGDRPAYEIIKLTDIALQPLIQKECDVIVIACNTATAAAIEWLRAAYPAQKFIGLEPMVKPAVALSKTGVIAICATPATLSSKRYLSLKKRWLTETMCLEPNCKSWATMIESSVVNHQIIKDEVEDVLTNGADVIVLACTHYHWIRSEIEMLVNGRAVVIDPTEAILERIKHLTK